MEEFMYLKLKYGVFSDQKSLEYRKNIIIYETNNQKIECKDKEIIDKLDEIINENRLYLEEYSDKLDNDSDYSILNVPFYDCITISFKDKLININNMSKHSNFEELSNKYEETREKILNLIEEYIEKNKKTSNIEDFIRLYIKYGDIHNPQILEYNNGIITYLYNEKKIECTDENVISKLEKIIVNNRKVLEEYSDALSKDSMPIQSSFVDSMILAFKGKYISIGKSKCNCSDNLPATYEKVRKEMMDLMDNYINENMKCFSDKINKKKYSLFNFFKKDNGKN